MWVAPCNHKGPYERQGVGSELEKAVYDKGALPAWMGKAAPAKGCGQSPEAGRGRQWIPPQLPREGSPADHWISTE